MEDDSHHPERIVADRGSIRVVRMVIPEAWGVEIVPLDEQSGLLFNGPEEFEQGDLVVINRRRIQGNVRRYEREIPGFVEEPPPEWVPLSYSSWNRMSVYYVGGAAMRVVPEIMDHRLTGLFHAYPFEEGEGEVAELSSDPPRFLLRNATDVRLVLGPGRYHVDPSADPMGTGLRFSEPGRYGIRWALRVDDGANLEEVRVITFDETGEAAQHDRLVAQDAAGRVYGTWLTVHEDSPVTFRLYARLTGNGLVEVTELDLFRVGPIMRGRAQE